MVYHLEKGGMSLHGAALVNLKRAQLPISRRRCLVHNQKCMYGAALAISANRWSYLVIFGMPLEPCYFELVIVGFR